MASRQRSRWQKIKQHRLVIGIVAFVALMVIASIILVFVFGWDWTGFSGGESKITITSTAKGTTIAKELQPARTLWDWLGLLAVLAIPVVVGFGAAWFTAQQGEVSDRENTDNQRETALQAYIDNMSELLLHENLRGSAEDAEVRKIARVRTLTVLPRLDKVRKRSVLLFLHESELIDKDKPIVNLNGADLSNAKLSRTDWDHTNLRRANLRKANLWRAYLDDADLSHADLQGAKLNPTTLMGTTLKNAQLQKADLSSSLRQYVKCCVKYRCLVD